MLKNSLVIFIGLLSLTVSQAFAFNCPSVSEVKNYPYTYDGHIEGTPPDWRSFDYQTSPQQNAGIMVKAKDTATAEKEKNVALQQLHVPTKTTIKTTAGTFITCVYKGKLNPQSPQSWILPAVAVTFKINQGMLAK